MATLNPYLNFRGTAREAMEFYSTVFGGDLTVSTFADYNMPVDPSEADKVMHAQLTTPSGYRIMGADTPSYMEFSPGVNSFSVSLNGPIADHAELSGYFAALAEGGEISQPLVEAPWGDSFGMVVDKFGVSWLVNIGGPEA
jgi:PhnB protein